MFGFPKPCRTHSISPIPFSLFNSANSFTIFSVPHFSRSLASSSVKYINTRPSLSVQPFFMESSMRSINIPYSSFASVERASKRSSVQWVSGTIKSVIVNGDNVLVGFREAEWKEKI